MIRRFQAHLPLTALILLTCSGSATARDQRHPNGILPAEPGSRATFEEDELVRGSASELTWLTWRHIHPSKDRSWHNLKVPQRESYRGHLAETVLRLWQRGVQNDLARVVGHVDTFAEMTEEFDHDPRADQPVKSRTIRVIDGAAALEYARLEASLRATPPGFRLAPLSNVEHLTGMPGKQAFAGMGALTVSYPLDETAVVRARLERHYRWGRHMDEDVWKQPLAEYGGAMGKRDSLHLLLGQAAIGGAEKTQELLADGSGTLFAHKNAFFAAAWSSGDGRAAVNGALDLIAEAEVCQAELARTGEGDAVPGRNQMDGLCMRIGGLARAFVDGPSPGALLMLGCLGVVGAAP